MSLLGIFKRRIPTPPKEVIQAACDFYGIASESVSSVQAEKLKALSDTVWVVTLNEQASALVAYDPVDDEEVVVTEWYDEVN
jgi:hypothetical protein